MATSGLSSAATSNAGSSSNMNGISVLSANNLRKNLQAKGFFSRMQGAIACAVAPPKLVVDKKSIEKSWKLMDKVDVCYSGVHGALNMTEM